MKVFQINFYDMFSTGNIMLNIAKVGRERGHEMKTASKATKMSADLNRHDQNHIYVGNRLTNTVHRYFSWVTDFQDCGSVTSTLNLIRKIKKFNPDIIHLHDVVGWYINLDILFNYLAKANKPVVWTFHDCWAFTGRCIYFDAVGCDRWKTGCGNCPQIHYMPRSWWFDRSAWNWEHKRKLFTAIQDLTIVTPSKWLAELTKESFLGDKNIRVINNGINLGVFKPTEGDIFKELKSDGKRIILGVAGTWSARKGLNDFISLSKMLKDDEKLVLVGLDPSEISGNNNITAIRRTHNASELAEIYTAADVFVNPTYEDNFPTVNLESLACGTPVVTYATGGSPESVTDGCGLIVTKGNVSALHSAIEEILSHRKEYYFSNCIFQSKAYNMNARFDDYISLYEEILNPNIRNQDV